MKKLYLFIFLLLSSIFWFSCDKEIELLAEYEDIPIVYGLINPGDSINYLRIGKAFLTDGDIYDAAAIQDSNQYPYKLNVRIYSDNMSVTFDTMTIHNKEFGEDGIFYAPDMQVYYAETKDLLNDEDVYYLEVENPVTGTIVTSSTTLIEAKSIKYEYPSLYTKRMDFTKDKEVKFKSIKNGRLYQLNIRFHYGERNIVTGDSIGTYTDWVFPTFEADYLDGSETIKYPYVGEQFYLNLENDIRKNHDTVNIKRYIGPCELIVVIADETFNTFLETNQPSTSLVIDRLTFTNIENGYGLFASRTYNSTICDLSDPSKSVLKKYELLNF